MISGDNNESEVKKSGCGFEVKEECGGTADDSKMVTPIYHIKREISAARNRKFVKDLEIAKARLRTYAVYTPTDREVRLLETEYRKHLRHSSS